jgi:Transglycosylase SLT domain
MIVEPTGSNLAATGAIRQAAQMTGADFKYLLATAQVESSLNPNAKAASSSARGLFQFTDQTWLATLKEQGPAFGYGPYAAAVSRQPGGDYAVTDPGMTRAVMNLRFDPIANSLMAGAFTKANSEKLASRLDRNPTEGELYIAHFLGSSGAGRMIELVGNNPQTSAAAAFPTAARANPSIFFNDRGSARSVGEIYRLLVGRYDAARNRPATAVPATPAASAPTAPPVSFASSSANFLAALPAASGPQKPRVIDNTPVFHGLFRSSGEPEPVAPLVNSLWTTPTSPSGQKPRVIDAATDTATSGAGRDTGPDAGALFRGRQGAFRGRPTS